jgi:protein involved in polysaccharide export with SLBB domain
MQAPDWRLLETVWVTGEVRFPGKYTIRDKSERVRDLIARAGGLLPAANLDAAYLGRRRAATSYQNAADKTANSAADKTANSAADKTTNSMVRVGADIATAFAQPASQDNLLVEAGDSLDIPVEQATVEVRGAVNLPTTTVVSRGASISYYLRAAGGVSTSGDVSRSYVIQPNGKIEARRGFWFLTVDPTPRPGATVVIPVRDTTSSSSAALLGTISTISSVVAGLLTAYALVKR